MKNKKGILIFFIIALIVVGIIATFEYIKRDQSKEEVKPSIPSVIAEKAIKEEFTLSYDTSGKIISNSYKIGADIVKGRVSSVYVEEGDYISAGDAVLSLDVTSSVSQLKLQIVGIDRNINDIDLSLEQLRSKKEETEKLLKNGIVAKDKLDQVNDNIEKLETQRQGLIDNKYAINNQIYEISDVGVIYAKESGTVEKVKIKADQYPGRDDFIEIKMDQKPKTRIYLTESIVKKISLDEVVDVNLDDKVYKGRVKEIFSLNQGEILYPVDIEIDSEEAFLADTSVKIKIPTYTNKNAVLVNRKAIINFNDEVYLYKVVEGKAIKTNIVTGETLNSMTEVKNGIQEGDIIITEGQFSIGDNQEVQILDRLSTNP